jgi:pilus assembly protein CpaB
MALNLNKNWMILVAAIAVGAIAAFGAKNYINNRVADIEARDKNKATVKVVVAKEMLEKGIPLTAKNMAVRDIPKEWVHSNAITPDQFSRVEGTKLAYPAQAGEPVVWSQLEGESIPSFSSMLIAGRRAVTVPVDEISSLSGMVAPGDLIDIVVSTQKDSKNYTFTLLQSIKVLATGTQISNDKKDAQGNAMTYNTITLDTLPDDAKRIIAAREVGKITALLRSPGDESSVSMSRSDAAALLGLSGYKGVSSVPVIYGGGEITEGLSMKDPKELDQMMESLNQNNASLEAAN